MINSHNITNTLATHLDCSSFFPWEAWLLPVGAPGGPRWSHGGPWCSCLASWCWSPWAFWLWSSWPAGCPWSWSPWFSWLSWPSWPSFWYTLRSKDRRFSNQSGHLARTRIPRSDHENPKNCIKFFLIAIPQSTSQMTTSSPSWSGGRDPQSIGRRHHTSCIWGSKANDQWRDHKACEVSK